VVADRGGEQAVDREDDEDHQHEDGAQRRHAGQLRAFPPNHPHQSWRDVLYWDSELEA